MEKLDADQHTRAKTETDKDHDILARYMKRIKLGPSLTAAVATSIHRSREFLGSPEARDKERDQYRDITPEPV